MEEFISSGSPRLDNPKSKIIQASQDSNMSKKAMGKPQKGGSNNIMDLADHSSSKNGANAANGKGGL